MMKTEVEGKQKSQSKKQKFYCRTICMAAAQELARRGRKGTSVHACNLQLKEIEAITFYREIIDVVQALKA